MHDDSETSQAQLDELWQRGYNQGYVDAKRDMQSQLQHLKPNRQAHPSAEAMPEAPIVSDSTPLLELSLPLRVYYPLQRAGYQTIGDLVSKTEDYLLLQTRNIGPASIAEIKQALRKLGYRLASRQPGQEAL